MRSPSHSTAICAEPSTWPAGWKRHRDAAERQRLAIADRLRRAGEILAVAQPHDVERLLRRQHRAVAGARMIGMAVRDQRLVDRPGRIDVEAAGLAADAGRGRNENVFGTHCAKICRGCACARRSGRELGRNSMTIELEMLALSIVLGLVHIILNASTATKAYGLDWNIERARYADAATGRAWRAGCSGRCTISSRRLPFSPPRSWPRTR